MEQHAQLFFAYPETLIMGYGKKKYEISLFLQLISSLNVILYEDYPLDQWRPFQKEPESLPLFPFSVSSLA